MFPDFINFFITWTALQMERTAIHHHHHHPHFPQPLTGQSLKAKYT